MSDNSKVVSRSYDKLKEGEPPDERKKNRRGKGSKSKQAEIFRTKKNKEFDAELTARMENLKISFGYSPSDLFGERALTSIVKPPIEFPVDTSFVGHLCRLVAEVLHNACRIPAAPESADDECIEYDVETLMWVTALQLESKMQAARSGTSFLPSLDQEVDFRTHRTTSFFKKSLIPLAVVIDQIGRFSIAEQLFVPACNSIKDFIYYRLYDTNNECRLNFRCFTEFEQKGCPTSFTDHVGRRMRAIFNIDLIDKLREYGIFIDDQPSLEFLVNPGAYPYIGLVQFVPEITPPAPLPFQEVARRYAELEGRVLKKLNHVFVEPDIIKGEGTESQLVFRRSTGGEVFTAWSPRAIRADSLELGAILGLGFPCQLGTESIAAVSATIDTAAGLETLANVLTKRIR